MSRQTGLQNRMMEVVGWAVDDLVERLLASKGLIGIVAWMGFQYLRRRFSAAAQARKEVQLSDSTDRHNIQSLNDAQVGDPGEGALSAETANAPVESGSANPNHAVLTALTERVRHFSNEVRHDRRFDSLRNLYSEGVQRPADHWVLEARKGVAVPADEIHFLHGRQRRFEKLRSERLQSEVAERIAHLEAVAAVAMEPIVALLKAEGDGLATAVPVVHLLAPGASVPVRERAGDPELGLLELPSQFESGANVLDYDRLLVNVGQGLFFEVSGLAESLFETLGLLPQASLPLARVEYDEQIAVGVLGPMLPGLFAQVFATLRGGPSRVHGLRLSLMQDASLPYVRSQSGQFSAEVPGLLRMEISKLTLDAMGYSIEGEKIAERFQNDHEAALDSVMLPRRSAAAVGIPMAFYRSVLGQVVELFVKTPCAALDGYRMLDIPGLAQGPREHEQVRRGAERIQLGGAPQGKALAKMLECMAAMAEPGDDLSLGETLNQALAGRGSKVASRTGHKREMPRDLGIHAGLRNRQVLREVLALDAALSPSAARRSL